LKLKICLVSLAIVCLLIPHSAGASTVFETTGWIIGTEGLVYEFTADIEPFTYQATITDLSVTPTFGLTNLFLSISTSTGVIDFRFGEGSFVFPAIEGNTYFANVFGKGGGDLAAGNFGLKIEAVPIPPSLVLFGSCILGMVLLRRKVR
jgi:hypothetical protein